MPKAMVTLLLKRELRIAAFPALNMIRLSICRWAATPAADPSAIPRLTPEKAQVVSCFPALSYWRFLRLFLLFGQVEFANKVQIDFNLLLPHPVYFGGFVDDYLLHKFIQQGSGKLGKLGVPLHQFDKLVSPG